MVLEDFTDFGMIFKIAKGILRFFVILEDLAGFGMVFNDLGRIFEICKDF